jgi:hypothetical protein
MTSVHLVLGVATLLSSLIAGAWGGYCWRVVRASQTFWYLLRIQQAIVAVQVSLGTLLLFLGKNAGNDLHYLYGGLPLVVTLIAEGARAGAASTELGEVDFQALPPDQQRSLATLIVRRETGIMAISCIVVFFLALRAAGTSTAF